MARSLIFLSTPTSATGSMFRVILAITKGKYRREKWLETLYEERRIADALHEVPPAEDALILHRTPQYFNLNMRLTNYRYVLNARDPRDLVCNQYHWQFSHPNQLEDAAQTEQRRERVRREGIDAFALRHDNTHMLLGFFNAARKIAPEDRIFVGYAMYCLHFNETVSRMCRFIGVAPEDFDSQQRKAIAREKSEDLADNPAWIGQQWSGSDTQPGRHKAELQPDTIAALNQRYAWFLDFLRRMDDPRVAHTYD
jgi:hypothetical protein